MELYARQGDLLIWKEKNRLSEPVDVHTVAQLEILKGEQTGHAHVIEDELEVGRRPYASGLEALFIRVGKPVQVVHDEHDPIPLEPGKYVFSRQRTWDWPERTTTHVVD